MHKQNQEKERENLRKRRKESQERTVGEWGKNQGFMEGAICSQRNKNSIIQSTNYFLRLLVVLLHSIQRERKRERERERERGTCTSCSRFGMERRLGGSHARVGAREKGAVEVVRKEGRRGLGAFCSCRVTATWPTPTLSWRPHDSYTYAALHAFSQFPFNFYNIN